MKYTQQCAREAIRVLFPEFDNLPNQSLPEAFNAAAVNSFLADGRDYSDRKHLAEMIVRTGIEEIRKTGAISFGDVEWEEPGKKAKQ